MPVSEHPRVASRPGNFLYEMRLAAGLTQERVAELLSVSNSYISKLEGNYPNRLAGKRDIIIDWAIACGVGPDNERLQLFLMCNGLAPWARTGYDDETYLALAVRAAELGRASATRANAGPNQPPIQLSAVEHDLVAYLVRNIRRQRLNLGGKE